MRGREERGRKPERRKINISSFFSLAVHGSEERKTTACGLMLIMYSYKSEMYRTLASRVQMIFMCYLGIHIFADK